MKSLRYNTLPHREIPSELYAGIIASGKEALSINQALHRANDPVSGEGDQRAEDNELDSQEELDNEFIMREEAARLAKSLLDCEAGMKLTSLNVMRDLLFMSVPQPQLKLDQLRRVSTTPKTRHEMSTSQSTMACMRSTSPPRKRVKTTGGQKIAKSIQGMVEELKKTREENTASTLLNKAIKFLVSRYGLHKNLLSNGLKLMKYDRNVGIFLALDGDNQKTWLEKECNALQTN